MIANIEIATRLKEACKPFDMEFTPCISQATIFVAVLPMMASRCGVDIAFDRREIVSRPDDNILKDFVHGRIKNRLTELLGYAEGLLNQMSKEKKE